MPSQVSTGAHTSPPDPDPPTPAPPPAPCGEPLLLELPGPPPPSPESPDPRFVSIDPPSAQLAAAAPTNAKSTSAKRRNAELRFESMGVSPQKGSARRTRFDERSKQLIRRAQIQGPRGAGRLHGIASS